ncbi:hypothetical protein M413DRAFT_155058 [Hebeloma cylindrosporum]|uniref:DUF659 domain-containing protein n=1 Tax=Hebeloma cylindrosporum TaxID=76867 RepID=A0A0C3C9H6_HEBCY|nr:hypothetical protein M413DRAFT_155058 [Hebeloma cylindrosporum h7]
MSVGRDTGRIRTHAKDCDKLAEDFPVLHRRVMKVLAGNSHSRKLDKLSAGPEQNSADVEQEKEGPKAQHGSILTYMNPAKISNDKKVKIELLMFQMFLCCALPWALLDSEFFANFVLALAPNFVIPDRSSFFTKHLSQEIAVWGEDFKEFLKGKVHLTLSLDGWSTRAKEEIYTFHTTTQRRRSFFTDGHVFRGVSVTGDALLHVAVKVSSNN